MSARAYLDHNATSPMRPEVRAAVVDAMAAFGNPSSVHREGRAARNRIERAREQVANLVGGRPEDVMFTSGGTEANHLALRPGALALAGRGPDRLVLNATEHPSVLSGHGFEPAGVHPVGVGTDGRVDPAGLAERLDELADEVALVSVQVANSETGVLQSVGELAALVHERGGLLHSDAVQAAGRVPLDLATLGVDALTLSAHKLGGPLGVGALILAPGREGEGLRRARGGAQEYGRRAGTENVAGIVGFGVAAELALASVQAEHARLRNLQDVAEAEIRRLAPAAVLFGAGADRLPNTVAFAVPGLLAETALIALDLEGVAVSSGSACSSGKVGRSHVLAAMGVPGDLASGAIRLSFGWNSCPEDVMRFSRAFEKLVGRLYERERRAA